MKIGTLITSSALGLSLLVQPVAAQSIEDIGKIILTCALTQGCGGGNPGPGPAPTPTRADETVRADQNALNYFGFHAGPSDGRMGRQTRSAIADFQMFMQYPVTGRLNDWERGKLIDSYYRAQSGAAHEYAGIIQTEGPRGLLRALNQPRTPPAPNPPVEPVPILVDNTKTLPDIPIQKAELSMAQHCGSVDLLTQANGGLVNANAITDASQALDEQFCAARDYAMSRARQLSGDANGAISAQTREQCAQFVATMQPLLDALETTTPEDRIAAAEAFALNFNAPAQQLRGIGEICLGVGYQTDDAKVVLAAAMLLIGAGERPYAEVLGHHLRRGFGTTTNAVNASRWYDIGLDSLDHGATPAFLPSQSRQRAGIIRAAIEAPSTIPGATNMSLFLPDVGNGN
ncbi:MAG: peptidoglycan-binding protein [Rhodobacteraceae bacterium]|nr:peptidoglycan-binding protein [Paracoccaceae bacterium]MCP5341760.1 peptidoglycan-binding protein [Paracoccaceae bacterium]